MTTPVTSVARKRFEAALAARRALKMIAGIANHDVNSVRTIAEAAELARVHALDVAADADVIRAARAAFSGFLFASGITADELMLAVDCGVDGIELGNFDALYAEGVFLDHHQVLARVADTLQRLAAVERRVFFSVTIPGHLSSETQVALAEALEVMGVDLIQTEGAARLLDATPAVAELSLNEKAAITLNNTRLLASATRLPVMSASGIGLNNLAAPFAMGAACVGIGSAVNKLANRDAMITTLAAMMATLEASPEMAAMAAV
ncbi:MAG: DUF561 domain-containing protein [Candidatus Melainabacteria bacterium]